MFDLFKDIDTYRGVTPYASEHYGVYQPLLGWDSRLSKRWVQRGGPFFDPEIKRILDGRLTPGPTDVTNGDVREFMATPLQPGSGRSPFTVRLSRPMNSELLVIVKGMVQRFVEQHEGRLPAGEEWQTLVDINRFLDPEGPLLQVNNTIRARLFSELSAAAAGGPITPAMTAAAKARHLQAMQYESQIATFLLAHVEGQDGMSPDKLAELFVVGVAPPLDAALRSSDPLANIDPSDRSGALSPVGFVHLFREYFFDLGTFLGEAVEHIWLAPGTSIELIEVSTRKTIVERTEEQSSESTQRNEHSTEVKDELSDAVKAESSSSTKLGVSTTNSVNYGVYQGTATVSLGLDSARKDAREIGTKNNKAVADKASTEIKASFKSVFRTVTETTDSRSRRYVLQNTGADLLNYELRRKMRRVGVQMQDIGQRLCWQVYVDDPGAQLGLSELVAVAESPDLSQLKQPDIPPPPAVLVKTVSARIPFIGMRSNDDNGPGADYGNTRPIEASDGKHHGNRTNTNDDDAADFEIVMGPFHYSFAPPQSDFALTGVRVLGPQGNKRASVRTPEGIAGDGAFDLVLESVNFGGASEVIMDVEVVYTPQLKAFADYALLKSKALDKYDADRQRLVEKTRKDNIRTRIKDASEIHARPPWDLREEERTIIYRNLIERLMLDSWDLATKNPPERTNARLSHVRAEVVRAIFDVDAMLYFVAPEWWMPRRHKSSEPNGASVQLSAEDEVTWGDVEKRDDNYLITEQSAPAKLGSSLGWLLQLDGDNLRNAFLNAPWVKAVVPVRPGRERAALNWLHALEGHENDGWDTQYVTTTVEDDALVAELAAAGKEATIGNVLEAIAARMEQENGALTGVLESDKVFEHGFDHLAGGFDAGLPANQVFSQWITVLPTDQLVALKYEPTTLFEP
jgi:hypothetical protein